MMPAFLDPQQWRVDIIKQKIELKSRESTPILQQTLDDFASCQTAFNQWSVNNNQLCD